MKKDKLKKVVPLSLSTILTFMPAANVLAETGDILNKANNKEYDVSSLNWSSLQALVQDIKDKNSDEFLREHISGKYYDPNALEEIRKAEIIKVLKENSVDSNNTKAVSEFIKNPNNLKLLLEASMKVEEKFIEENAVVIEDIDTYEKVATDTYVGNIACDSDGIFDNFYGYKKIKGDVSISGEYLYEITLEGITIEGDLIINAPNADITLKNVQILGEKHFIDIQNVKYGTANFDGVTVNQINASDPDGCVLNSIGEGIKSNNGETKLEISPENPSQFVLSGDFENVNLKITKPGSLKVELGAKVNNIDIEVDDSHSPEGAAVRGFTAEGDSSEGVTLEGDLSEATVNAKGNNKAPIEIAQDTIVGTVNKEQGAQGQITAQEGAVIETVEGNIQETDEIEQSSKEEVKRSKINRAEAAVKRAENKLLELQNAGEEADIKEWNKLQKDINGANTLIDRLSDKEFKEQKESLKARTKVVQDALDSKYGSFKANIEAKVAVYEDNVEAAVVEANRETADIEKLDSLIKIAKDSKKEISLKGLNYEDKESFRHRICEADAKLKVAKKAIDYDNEKKIADNKVKKYEKAANDAKTIAENFANKKNPTAEDEESVQQIINNAATLRPEIEFGKLSDSYSDYLQVRLSAADYLLAEAQKVLDDKKEYEALKALIDEKVKVYENLANSDLSTQDRINKALKTKNQIILSERLNSRDKSEFQRRIAAADKKVADAQKVIDYKVLKDSVEEQVTAYEGAVQKIDVIDLSTAEKINTANKLVDEAVNVKEQISLDGLNSVDRKLFNDRIKAADQMIHEAQKAIHDAQEANSYQALKDAVEAKVNAYEALVSGLISMDITQERIDNAKIAKFEIRYDGLKGDDRKYFAKRVEEASTRVNSAQNILNAKIAVVNLEQAVETNIDLSIKDNLLKAEELMKEAEKSLSKVNSAGNVHEELTRRFDEAKEKVAQARIKFDYALLTAEVDEKVKAYEALANGDLSTQKLIDTANVKKAEIDLDVFKQYEKYKDIIGSIETDINGFEARIASADSLVKAAQALIDENKDINVLKAEMETKVKAYEALADNIERAANNGSITQKLINEAKKSRAIITLSERFTEEDKAAFQLRLDAADAKVKKGEYKLNYGSLIVDVEAKVAVYEKKANGPLTNRKLIERAKAARKEVSLEGLEESDRSAFQARLNAADEKVNAAEAYINLVEETDRKISDYEKLVLQDLSTVELINNAKAARQAISLEGIEGRDKVIFQRRLDAADAKLAEKEEVLKSAHDIKMVQTFEHMEVPYGTSFEELNLPSKAMVKLRNGEVRELEIEWASGNYDSNKSGKYTLEGNLKLKDNITNKNELKVSIEVEVKEVILTVKTFKPFLGVFEGKVEGKNVKNARIELWGDTLENKLASAKLDSDGNFRITSFAGVDLLGNYSYKIFSENDEIIAQGKVIVPSEIKEVEAIQDIYVMQGTTFDNLQLPQNIVVALEDGTKELEVSWLTGNYNPNNAGEYSIEGILILKDGVLNENNIKASVKVIVNKVEFKMDRFLPNIGVFTARMSVDNQKLLKGDNLDSLTIEVWGDTFNNKLGSKKVDDEGKVVINLAGYDLMGRYTYKVINKEGKVISEEKITVTVEE